MDLFYVYSMICRLFYSHSDVTLPPAVFHNLLIYFETLDELLLLEYLRNQSLNIFCFLLPFAGCSQILSFQPIWQLKIRRLKSVRSPNTNRPISVSALAHSSRKRSSFLRTAVLWGKKDTHQPTWRRNVCLLTDSWQIVGICLREKQYLMCIICPSVCLSLCLLITFQNYKDHLHRALAWGRVVRPPWAAETNRS